MVVFGQSAFADYGSHGYMNPIGSISTAYPLTLGTPAGSQIFLPNETDFFKFTPGTNTNVKITLKTPECETIYTGPNNQYSNTKCLNYDFVVFKMVNGAPQNVSGTFTEGGISGTDVFTFHTSSSSTQYYIRVYGHPPTSSGTDPYGNPIYNYYWSNTKYYEVKAVYVS